MKKTLLTAGALLALTAGAALAQDINIAWDECAGGGGLTNKTTTCASNTGASILIASFTAPAPMPHLNGHAGVVDIQTSGASLSPWWRVDPAGSCRPNRLTGAFDFTGGPFGCDDMWAGGASGGIDVAVSAANRLRVRTVCAVPDFRAVTNDGLEHYVFKLTLSNAATVGACTGCTDAACIVFNSLLITQPAGEGDYTLTLGPSQYATWRGGVIDAPGCPDATPTQKSTWGSVKALYR